MKPGEYFLGHGDIELNAGRATATLSIANTGDRPIQVGSHYHFFETNAALRFDRAQARGMRLDIPAGTAVRFEPGQTRDVRLVAYAGDRVVHGFRGLVNGKLDTSAKRSRPLPNPPPVASLRGRGKSGAKRNLTPSPLVGEGRGGGRAKAVTNKKGR